MITPKRERSSGPSRAKHVGSGKTATSGKAKPATKTQPGAKTATARKKPVAATSETRRRGRPTQSHAETEARRLQILNAALSVFSAHGFEAARIDEIARKAGVAKGTIYLYYPNKQAMFEALVRTAAEPLLGDLSLLAKDARLPARELFQRVFALFRKQVLGTERKLIIRLVIAEGSRFPELAAFHHREVISRMMAVLMAAAKHAQRNGELATDGPVHYPQLIAAPLLLAVIWDGLFGRIEPLDIEGLLDAHTELLTVPRRKR